MDKFEDAFDKQMRFNFSQHWLTWKEQRAAAQRTSRSAVLDLDHNVGAHVVSTTDFCNLSCYIMEDIMRVMMGTRFFVCVAMDADFGGKQNQIAADQKKVNVAQFCLHLRKGSRQSCRDRQSCQFQQRHPPWDDTGEIYDRVLQ